MKQTKKSYLFTSFKPNPTKTTLSNEINIQSSYNLSFKNNIIEPSNNFSLLFESILGENYQQILNNSKSNLDTIVYLEIYEYIDSVGVTNCRIFVFDNNYNLFEYSNSKQMFLSHSISFKNLPLIFKNENSLIFSSTDDKMVVIEQSNNPIIITPSSNIEKFCLNNNTLYFTSTKDKYHIYHSSNTALINISDDMSNYDSFSLNVEDGEVVEIFSFNKKLYVIQQYKISRLDTSSSGSILSMCCKTNCKIFKNSACLFDDYIILNSSAGLFKFDGNDIKFIFEDITCSLNLSNSIGVSYNNKYYLKTTFNDDNFNIFTDVIIEFNLDKNTFEIFYLGKIDSLFTLKTSKYYHLVVVINDNDCFKLTFLDSNKKSTYFKYLQSNKFSLNSSNLKLIKDVQVNGHGSFEMVVKSNLDKKTLTMSKNLKASNIALLGNIFQILIISDSEFVIESIAFNIVETEDYYD